MIKPSARWRFVEEIDDKGYFEDEIVQHHLIEFRALRRSFSDKFCSDPVAVEEVREQMKLAARCNSTLLPIVFAVEEVEGRLTIIQELIKGEAIKHLITRQQLSKARPFSEFAHRLVENLVDARQVGARYERLDVHHIVIVPSGDICVTQRFPIGPIAPDVLEKSPYLRRLNAQVAGGVYTSLGPADDLKELKVLRELLTKVAAGSTKVTFDDLRAEAARNQKMYPSPIAHVETEIAEVLMRLSSESGRDGQIMTLEGLRDALASLKRASQAKKEQPGLQKPLEYARVEDLPPGVAPPSADPPQPSHRVSDSLYRMPEPGDIKDPISSSGMAPVDPTPLPSSPAPKKPSSGILRKGKKAAATAELPEDLNPYASDEEVSEVREKEQSSGPVLSPVVAKKSNKGPMIKVAVIVILIVALIGAGAAIVPQLLGGSRPNEPPTARIMPLGSAFGINEEVRLDASGSSDPEGESLTYFWQAVSPDVSLVFTDPETGRDSSKTNFVVRSPKVIVQFQGTGEHELELKVKDQAQFSETVRIAVTVK